MKKTKNKQRRTVTRELKQKDKTETIPPGDTLTNQKPKLEF